MADQFDLVVIGGGPGGYASAFYAASCGMSVALVERDTIGGTCLNRGCIPAKAFLETAAANRHVAHASEFGINANSTGIDFSVSQARKARIVDGLVKGLTGLTRSKKVTYLLGTGSLEANRVVNVQLADGTATKIQANNVILASGSVPRTIKGFPIGGSIMTSDEVLMLDTIPKRIAVIGGGAIGCEFASTFADLGSEVSILEGAPKILPGLDPDVANVVVKSFTKKKINIKTGIVVTGQSSLPDGSTQITFATGDPLIVDVVIMSIGRRAFSDALGLSGTAVKVDDRGFVVVNEYCQTAEPGVYAIGDLINTPQLAHVAYAEAILSIKHLRGESATPIMYNRVPWAIYCHPEVAWAGPSEEQARDAGHEVVVAKHQFRANSRAMILGEIDGLVKVIAKKNADGTAGQVLGVHMVGPWVTEQLAAGYLAVNWEASVDEIAEFVMPHPSLSELFGETILSLTGRSFNA
ncbi:MAG: dihydrolipoyl dehydrogenase [Actinobacteria bacterium]|nr:dihydrolipoyl dehydrogenase [Actinomycetota bacterium]